MTNIKIKLGSNGFSFNIFNGKADKQAPQKTKNNINDLMTNAKI